MTDLTFTTECGLCGRKIKIIQESDGRYLHWSCHCLSERDAAIAEGLTAVLDNLMRASRPLGEREERP